MHRGQWDPHPLWMSCCRNRCSAPLAEAYADEWRVIPQMPRSFPGDSTGHSSVAPWFHEQSLNLFLTGNRDTNLDIAEGPSSIFCHILKRCGLLYAHRVSSSQAGSFLWNSCSLVFCCCEGSIFVFVKVAWRVGRPNWQCCSLSFKRAYCGLFVAQAHSVCISPCSTQLSHRKLHFVVSCNICFVIE